MQSFQQYLQQLKSHNEWPFKRYFGNTKVRTLRLNYLKKTNETKRINRQFASNPKAVYCLFLNASTNAKETPTREEVESHWTNI